MALVELKNIVKSFRNGKTETTVLRGIDLKIESGETYCVVGESGCGKTTLGKILAGLSDYSGGSYLFEGKEVSTLKGEEWKHFRQKVQMIHQNPYESLNPSMMVFDMIANPLRRHKGIKDTGRLYEEVSRLLEIVGLTPVDDFVDKYPAFLSGGQRQRVSIARILALDPSFIVVDEATSMIDTSLRISLLTTLKEIQEKMDVAYFFITHDLALGKYFASGKKMMIMYLGQVVEEGDTRQVVSSPAHPYTKAILTAARGNTGILEEKAEDRFELLGVDIPSFSQIPSGCPLHPRCPLAVKGLCDVRNPEMYRLDDSRLVSCLLCQGDQK